MQQGNHGDGLPKKFVALISSQPTKAKFDQSLCPLNQKPTKSSVDPSLPPDIVATDSLPLFHIHPLLRSLDSFSLIRKPTLLPPFVRSHACVLCDMSHSMYRRGNGKKMEGVFCPLSMVRKDVYRFLRLRLLHFFVSGLNGCQFPK